jgi:peroxiredoxin Q/BCP
VLGVSYDTPEKNRKFAEKNGLPFLLLSDSDHELAESVGAARALLPFAKRVSYLVGPDGLVLETYPEVDPKTHASEVLEDYRAIIANAE